MPATEDAKYNCYRKLFSKSTSNQESEESTPFNSDKFPMDSEVFHVTLMRTNIHGYLVFNIYEERTDPISGSENLHRVVKLAEFVPASNFECVVGRGKINVQVLEEDTPKLREYLKKYEQNPTFTVPMSKLPEIIRNPPRNDAPAPVYVLAGDSSNHSSNAGNTDKGGTHNCISWCEEVLKEMDIILQSTDKLRPVKVPAYIIWKAKRQQERSQ